MFNNLRELITTLPDEKSCREYLAKARWEDGKAICPYCGHGRSYNIEGGKRYKCASASCYKKFSVTVGTIFEASNIPLTKWFMALYLLSAHKKGISSHQLARDIGVAQKSAWFMLHRIREMMRAKEPVTLSNTVQIDETYVGGLEKNKHASKRNKNAQGRGSKKAAVFGVLETNGNVVAKVVPIINRDNLNTILDESVAKDAVIVTDAFRVYSRLKRDYRHIVVNHTIGVFVEQGFHTNGVENFWSLLKRGITGIYHQVTPKHLQRYCDEFTYRFNSRKVNDAARFNFSLGQVEGRLDWKTLTKKLNH